MAAVCNLSRDLHAGFLADFIEPCESGDAYTLESAGLGSGFPDAGSVDFHSFACKLGGCFEHLFFCFGAAGA